MLEEPHFRWWRKIWLNLNDQKLNPSTAVMDVLLLFFFVPRISYVSHILELVSENVLLLRFAHTIILTPPSSFCSATAPHYRTGMCLFCTRKWQSHSSKLDYFTLNHPLPNMEKMAKIRTMVVFLNILLLLPLLLPVHVCLLLQTKVVTRNGHYDRSGV